MYRTCTIRFCRAMQYNAKRPIHAQSLYILHHHFFLLAEVVEVDEQEERFRKRLAEEEALAEKDWDTLGQKKGMNWYVLFELSFLKHNG